MGMKKITIKILEKAITKHKDSILEEVLNEKTEELNCGLDTLREEVEGNDTDEWKPTFMVKLESEFNETIGEFLEKVNAKITQKKDMTSILKSKIELMDELTSKEREILINSLEESENNYLLDMAYVASEIVYEAQYGLNNYVIDNSDEVECLDCHSSLTEENLSKIEDMLRID